MAAGDWLPNAQMQSTASKVLIVVVRLRFFCLQQSSLGTLTASTEVSFYRGPQGGETDCVSRIKFVRGASFVKSYHVASIFLVSETTHDSRRWKESWFRRARATDGLKISCKVFDVAVGDVLDVFGSKFAAAVSI